MKKSLLILLAAVLLLSLASCSSSADTLWTGVLYADFTCGVIDAELEYIKEYPFEYTGEQMTPEALAGELTALTGLEFKITATQTDDGLTVDWASDSMVFSLPDDFVQKDEFMFFDASTLRWFMLDSLYRTLIGNLDVENIYYTMDGGKELVFDELQYVTSFPSDIPFMGSAFYGAHSDVKGD